MDFNHIYFDRFKTANLAGVLLGAPVGGVSMR